MPSLSLSHLTSINSFDTDDVESHAAKLRRQIGALREDIEGLEELVDRTVLTRVRISAQIMGLERQRTRSMLDTVGGSNAATGHGERSSETEIDRIMDLWENPRKKEWRQTGYMG